MLFDGFSKLVELPRAVIQLRSTPPTYLELASVRRWIESLLDLGRYMRQKVIYGSDNPLKMF